MPMHPLDRSVGSDLSFLVFQRRARQGELGTQALDSSNQRLYPLPSQLVEREAFIADRGSVIEQDETIPSWHFRGRKGRKG